MTCADIVRLASLLGQRVPAAPPVPAPPCSEACPRLRLVG
jgi:hypothetical protein